MNVILCGLPGSGKSTIAARLADTLKRPLIDTDSLIEERGYQGVFSCREIFRKYGEKVFRVLEGEVVHSLGSAENCVIAIGGGVLLNRDHADPFKSLGKIVYLKGEVTVFFQRVLKGGVPAYLNVADPKRSYLELAKKRCPVYEKFADVTVDVGLKSVKEIVEEICGSL